MIINNFNIIRVAIQPAKAYPPLVIDANAPLSFSVSRQLFQPVGRRYLLEIDDGGTVNLSQFSQSRPLNIHRYFPRKEAGKDSLCLLTPEILDHVKLLTHRVSNVNNNRHV